MTYLLAHPNRHAPDRGDGRYWGYPTRRRPIVGIVIHTAEALDPDMADGDQTAERVARYFAGTDRPASAHVVVDADSKIVLLPDGHTAFHAKGCNADGLGLEIAYRAADWGTRPDREQLLLDAAADVCADWCRIHGIPVARHVTVDGWRAHGGLIAHAHVDPDRRTDPGPRFPWDRFLRMIRDRLKEHRVEPILYARRGTPDFHAACAAVDAAGRGSVSCDLVACRKLARAGADVIAVGGPATRDIPEAVAVYGDGALQTMAAIAEHLAAT